MRKVALLAIIVGASIGLLRPENASAQSIYAVKFVCGRQAPLNNVTPPVEPPVKPGNYATKVNVELLSPTSPANGGPVATWNFSLAGDGLSASVPISLSQLQTIDFTCSSIVNLAGKSPNVPSPLPPFIEGYVNIIANPGVQLAVTGVYTSQGCTFPLTTFAVVPPICSGPVSIEVVPALAAPFTAPPA